MKKQKNNRSFLEWLWLGLPVSIWFSFHPLIRFGKSETMYFELSITVIYILILALASLPIVWRERRRIYSNKSVRFVAAFVAISSLSLLWTANSTRGILATGVLGMLFVVFLGASALQGKFNKLVPKIIRVYLFSAVVACFLAIVQFFAGIWLDSSVTLLCAGCVAEQFGFVRPSLFLIEPQFLSSALLPAGLIAARSILAQKRLKLAAWDRLDLLSIVVFTLVLTLSRGALLAFVVGLLVLIFIYRNSFSRLLLTGAVIAFSGVAALGAQGLAAAINPNIEGTFMGAISRSVNQLSMGVINIPTQVEESEKPEPSTNNADQPNFDGYVEESTSARTTRTELALGRWGQDIQTALLGVGVGSAGVAIHEKYPDKLGAREIVQNEYVEILLERGLIGLIVFMALLAGVFWVSREQKWLWAIAAAFMTQWIFFSGYPNALHVYLVLIIIGAYFTLRRDQLELARRY